MVKINIKKRDIANIARKSRSVIYSIIEIFEETGPHEAKTHPAKVQMLHSDGRRCVRRNPIRHSPKSIKSSVKFRDGSVQVFGMISAAATSYLIQYDNIEKKNHLANYVISHSK